MHAWNYGKRSAEGGHAPPSQTYLDIISTVVVATAPELEAYRRLGDASFHAWALRGWWAAHTERSST